MLCIGVICRLAAQVCHQCSPGQGLYFIPSIQLYRESVTPVPRNLTVKKLNNVDLPAAIFTPTIRFIKEMCPRAFLEEGLQGMPPPIII